MTEVTKIWPGGAPDEETFKIMERLSELQHFCTLIAIKDLGQSPNALEPMRIVQDARGFIVERLYGGGRS